MKKIFKIFAELCAFILALPFWLFYRVYALCWNPDRGLAAISQFASLWPGLTGQYFRQMLFRLIIEQMGTGVVISFGSLLTRSAVRLGNNVYIGAYCLLGRVHIGPDTLIADHVCIPSGALQHGFSRLDIPLRDQPGDLRTVHIGSDCWIGSNAVILADLGAHCIVGAGAVVTHHVHDYQIVAGNPARVIGDRRNPL